MYFLAGIWEFDGADGSLLSLVDEVKLIVITSCSKELRSHSSNAIEILRSLNARLSLDSSQHDART